MNLMLYILFWIAVIGSTTSTIYCLMVLFVAERFGRRRRRDDRSGPFQPPVSILKPLHGLESGLEQNLISFFEQDYPDFELLFCARHEADEGLRLARIVGSRYPVVKARYFTCGEPLYPNAKMYSVMLMSKAAEHDVVVASDADARVERTFLRRVVQPLADGKVALTWCPYLGTTNTSSLSTQLDAVGKSVEMGSGVLVADLVEGGTNFALGVSMALRRQAFDEAGGFVDLGQFPAEDYVIGNRLAAQGKGVLISPHVIRLMIPETSYAVSFKNQLRWMQSTRRSRPMGHLGTGLTFSVPFGLMGLLWGVLAGHPIVGVLWLFGSCVNRWLQAGVMLRALGEQRLFWPTFLYPLRDFLGGALWAFSYMPAEVYYHGGRFSIGPDGRYKEIAEKAS